MPMVNIEEFYCNRCNYITRSKVIIEQIKKTGIYPDCQNGKFKLHVCDDNNKIVKRD